MKPTTFKFATTYAMNQPPYLPLPAIRKEDGRILIGWKLSLRERLSLLLTGTLYHQVLTFNKPLQPIKMTVVKPEEFHFELTRKRK